MQEWRAQLVKMRAAVADTTARKLRRTDSHGTRRKDEP